MAQEVAPVLHNKKAHAEEFYVSKVIILRAKSPQFNV